MIKAKIRRLIWIKFKKVPCIKSKFNYENGGYSNETAD